MNDTLPVESDAFFNGITQEWTLRFVWDAPVWTMNAANNEHHRVRAQKRAEFREAFRLMANGCDPLDYADVTVGHVKGTRRNVDVCACVPAFKAALDGIVLAGVLPDDRPEFVRSVTFDAPTYEAGRDALVVTLVGPPAGRAS